MQCVNVSRETQVYLEQVKFLRPHGAIPPCRLLERSDVQNLSIEVPPALLVRNKGHTVTHVHTVYALREDRIAAQHGVVTGCSVSFCAIPNTTIGVLKRGTKYPLKTIDDEVSSRWSRTRWGRW